MASIPKQYDRGRLLRSQSVAASALQLIERAVKSMRRDMVMANQRIDEVLFHYMLSRFALWYSAVTAFLWAHALGVVWGQQLERRKSCCGSCDKKRTDGLGVTRCHGYPNESCGCPQKVWWKPGYLKWMQRLRNRPCPQGFFGRWFEREAKDGN